ncbi:lipocalin family protein [Celerinatantimonas sp. YJH-8]|uniref:lipocalin family protein n=1 Tax=Celerinatantimonas sp. YJH-8 TaxID=3228714 RepID=UPI0038C33C01
MRFKSALWLLLLTLSGCTGIPAHVTPVTPFDANRYLGKWYEIARLDHSFEAGLTQVSANYSLRHDGGLNVLNRGFNPKTQQWKQAQGKAFWVRDPNTGYLKVSFFGPFYGAYVIFSLGADYQYAMVSGPSHDYLWLLARTPQVSERLKTRFISQAKQRGFDTQKIIWVQQP